MNVLITGTSGFIGRALAEALSGSHNVVCLSRKPTEVAGATTLVGDFSVAEELTKLDPYDADVVLHLAAVTGGGSEEDGLRVNVCGTHHLLRYWISRGCRKFVLASSIAATGFQSVKFRPLQLPMPDEHPCLDRDGYGVSKYLMEEVTRYLCRQNDDLGIVNLRLASIVPDDRVPTPREPGPVTQWALGSISLMYLSDAVRCLTMAAEAPHQPGVRIMNAVGAQACVACTVPEIVRAWYGDDAEKLDLSHYEQPGHERDPVFDITRIREELGFVPERSVLG
jgi:UDP-glucose 4-epimerase